MPSSHIMKPVADILLDYVDAVRTAETYHAMDAARNQAVLELQCSYGLSRSDALVLLGQGLVVALIGMSASIPHKEICGALASESAPAANFV